jgi:membrane-associated phospholipid phosphatase
LILSGIAVMRFKQHFRVRRPADHSSLIQPVLLTPSHGSYPAGHGSQGNILAAVLTNLVGNKLGGETGAQLQLLADRVGENRVIAGLHYEEDITAGATLGQGLAKYFNAKTKVVAIPGTALEWLGKNAAAEWA